MNDSLPANSLPSSLAMSEHLTQRHFFLSEPQSSDSKIRLRALLRRMNDPSFIRKIESISTDVTSTSEDFDLMFKTIGGGTLSEQFRIKSTGDLVVPEGTLGKMIRTKVTIAGGTTLRQIGTIPQTIIAAPGANKYLNIVSISISYNYNSAVYNFGGTEIPFFKITGAANGWMLGTGIINAAADANRSLFLDNSASDWGVDNPTNAAFVLTTKDAGDATTGDGDLDVVVYYTIEDVNT